MTLVDPVSAKEYGVVYDSQQRPQASELPFSAVLDQSLHLAWVKFPAPPPTTQALDVVFPNGARRSRTYRCRTLRSRC